MYNTPNAAIAQSVERIHGKDEAPGSNPGRGSRVMASAFAGVFCFASHLCWLWLEVHWTLFLEKSVQPQKILACF